MRVVANAYEQRWLRQIKSWKDAGWSNWKIAAELNKTGVPTKVPPGTIRRVSVKVNGSRQVIAAPTKGGWKPITVWKILRTKAAKELFAKKT
jgi:hypothetical protein